MRRWGLPPQLLLLLDALRGAECLSRGEQRPPVRRPRSAAPPRTELTAPSALPPQERRFGQLEDALAAREAKRDAYLVRRGEH